MSLTFEVEKQHHRMTWLTQKRVLLITSTHIKNCKPGNPPEVTKSLPISDIVAVALKDRENFSVQFRSDHDYFFRSEQALEIAWEIKKRIAANNAVDKLAASTTMTDEVKEDLCSSFCTGELQLPQCSKSVDLDADAAASAGALGSKGRSSSVIVNFISLKMEMMFVLRSGNLPGATEISEIVRNYADLDVDFIDFSKVREIIDDLKGPLIDQLKLPAGSKEKRKSIPFTSSEVMANIVAEDVLEVAIIIPLYDKLWEALSLQSDVAGMENAFYNKCLVMEGKPSDGVDEALLGVNYDLVLDQLQTLVKQQTPSQMLDVLVNVAKMITLTIRAAGRADTANIFALPSELDSPGDAVAASSASEGAGSPSPPRSSAKPNANSLAADDVLPLYIHLLVHSKVRSLVLVREWIQRLGDPTECSERTYFFTMFASAIEYITSSSRSQAEEASCEQHKESSPGVTRLTRSKSCSPYSSPGGRLQRSATFVNSPQQ